VIAWDWNGTLLDDLALVLRVLNGLRREAGLSEVTREHHRRHFRFPVREYYESLGFPELDETFPELSRKFVERFRAESPKCALAEGMPHLLEEARQQGYRQAILTACNEDYVRSSLAERGIEPYFDWIVGRGDNEACDKVGEGRRLVELTGHRPEEILLIGDTLHDAEVAEALGLRCHLVTCGHQDEKVLGRSSAPNFPNLIDAFGAILGETRAATIQSCAVFRK
jgi:phosphoglycolate phosphatase